MKRSVCWFMFLSPFVINCSNGSGEDCSPKHTVACVQGEVYWYDSCGNQEDLAETCECGCNSDYSGCEDSCCQPECTGKLCGNDGCGGTCPPGCGENGVCGASFECECEYLECGGECCGQDAVCHEDSCCTPECDGKQCGDDGCGDVCGDCGAGQACVDGLCVSQGPDIVVCSTDCTGDQLGDNCVNAPSHCNHEVIPSDLLIDFGVSDLGGQVIREITIANEGTADLEVTSVSINGQGSTQYRLDLTGSGLPGTLGVGEQVVIQASFHPEAGGEHQASVEIVSSDGDEGLISVGLLGSSTAQRLCADPLLVDFGSVGVGEQEVLDLSLTNCGLADLELIDVAIEPLSSPDFSLVDPAAFPLTLTPGETTVILVSYFPGAIGSDTGAINVYSDDPASDPDTQLTGIISLSGNAVVMECHFLVNPVTLDFGTLMLGSSRQKVLTISNQGTDTCRVDSVEITANTATGEFGIVSSPSPGTTFEPDEELQVVLEFLPSGLGTDVGELTITGNDIDEPVIELDMIAQTVDQAFCDLEVDPTVLGFGIVALPFEEAMLLTVTNLGLSPCLIDELAFYPSSMFPSDFAVTQAPNVPFTVEASGHSGDQVEIEVTFSPQIDDVHRGVLWLHSPDDPNVIAGQALCWKPGFPPESPGFGDACIILAGNAVETQISALPDEVDFGVVNQGCDSVDLEVKVYNLSIGPVSILDIYLEDLQNPNFEILNPPVPPFELPGDESFSLFVRYRPQDLAMHSNTLFVESDATTGDLLAVPLFGLGTDIASQVDVFHRPLQDKTDVLFIVDNSGSMVDFQEHLTGSFLYFIGPAWSYDYHVGVIAVEVNEPAEDVGTPPRDILPGVLVQAPGHPKILDSSTPDLETAFAETAGMGDCCADEQEAGLQAAWMALSEPNVSDPAINGGFLRNDANLYIICVSDEEDQSEGTTEFYADFYRSLKGFRGHGLVKFSSIVGICPNGCDDPAASCGARYNDVAERTGGRKEAICPWSWDMVMSNLGDDAFQPVREFSLSRAPDPATIVVTAGGSGVPEASCEGCSDGWTFYPATNSIYLGGSHLPSFGEQISVEYTALCL